MSCTVEVKEEEGFRVVAGTVPSMECDGAHCQHVTKTREQGPDAKVKFSWAFDPDPAATSLLVRLTVEWHYEISQERIVERETDLAFDRAIARHVGKAAQLKVSGRILNSAIAPLDIDAGGAASPFGCWKLWISEDAEARTLHAALSRYPPKRWPWNETLGCQ